MSTAQPQVGVADSKTKREVGSVVPAPKFDPSTKYSSFSRLTGWQYWIGGILVNSQQYIYTYDGNGNQTGRLWQSWIGSSWMNSQQYIYAYDGNGNQTEKLWQLWNSSRWVNYEQHAYTYNGNGNVTSYLIQKWLDSIWVNSGQYTYIYDGNKSRIAELYQSWNDSIWVNNYQKTYSYDANGNQTGELCQNWNGFNWVNYYRYTYTWQLFTLSYVDEPYSTQISFKLSDNYPNPFNPDTKISYSVPKSSYVTLLIYDVLGREIAKLIQENKQPGEYTATWNADGVPSGVYFYRLSAGDFIQTKKMVLMR